MGSVEAAGGVERRRGRRAADSLLTGATGAPGPRASARTPGPPGVKGVLLPPLAFSGDGREAAPSGGGTCRRWISNVSGRWRPRPGTRSGKALEPAGRVASSAPAPAGRRHRRCCRKRGEGMMARGRTARLRLRAADTRREAASADRPGAGGAVDLPGLWTPGRRRAASAGRRGGRPQAVGNLAGDRFRLRRGREIPTGPQRFFSLMTHTQTSAHPGTCHDGNPSVNSPW